MVILSPHDAPVPFSSIKISIHFASRYRQYWRLREFVRGGKELSPLLSTKTDLTDLPILPVDDEKFELCCINPGLILGPVLHGSSCTSIEVLVFQYI